MAFHKTTFSRPTTLIKESDILERKKPLPKTKKTYCICGGPSDGLMIECETCKDWFHASCVGVEEKNIPSHYYCQTCVIDSKELEDTIVEALSLLAEQAATQSLNHLQDMSDREHEEFTPPLASDDKENVPNGMIRVEDHESMMKKRKALHLASLDTAAFGKSGMDNQIPSSPMSDTHSESDDSSPSTDPPSSPASPNSFSPSPHMRRNQPHAVTKTYTRKNKKQISVLEKYYEDHQSPDANMIHHIAFESNLPEQKVARWFYDKRRRSKQLNLH